MSSHWVIAVDGGGSKIAVAACIVNVRESHLPLSLETSRVWQFPGTGSAHPSTWELAAQHLQHAISSVIEELQRTEHTIGWFQLALAGAGRVEDQQRVIDTLQTRLPMLVEQGIALHCVGDIEPIVSPAVNSDTATIAVILGTGSIVAAHDADGKLVRAGGWGPILGDQCSGGALGLAALRAAAKAVDSGSVDESPLVQRVLAELTKNDAAIGSSLNTAIIQTAADRTRAAQLSLIVLELAFQIQDVEALQIVRQHIDEIAWQIEQVAQRGVRHGQSICLVFSGGLADRCSELCDAIVFLCRARGLAIAETSIANPLLATLQLAIVVFRSAKVEWSAE